MLMDTKYGPIKHTQAAAMLCSALPMPQKYNNGQTV